MSVACSVLYRPFSEMDLDEPYGAPPESAYYAQARRADRRHRGGDRAHRRRRRAQRAADLDARRACASCTASRAASTSARRRRRSPRTSTSWPAAASLYITLAHLFWRRVAANTPALPFLPDAVYNSLFPQAKGAALSPLGEAAVRAMYARRRPRRHQPHARRRDRRDVQADRGARPRDAAPTRRDYPVIASHAGYRFGGQKYNVSDATIARVAARGGVIGLIFAQHQINDGAAAHGHEDAGRVARRARPPHRRDRPRARRDRLRPRRLHQADARRDRVRRGPGAVRRRRCARATPRPPSRSSRATRCASSSGALPAQHPDAAHLHPDLAAGVHEPQQHRVAVRAAQDRAHARLVDVHLGDRARRAAAGAGRGRGRRLEREDLADSSPAAALPSRCSIVSLQSRRSARS